MLIEAPTILLKTAGAQIALTDSGITLSTSGAIQGKAASYDFAGRGGGGIELPGMPKSSMKTDEKFVLYSAQNGSPVANRRYRIELADGDVIEGVSDANGHTQLAHSETIGLVQITIYPAEQSS